MILPLCLKINLCVGVIIPLFCYLVFHILQSVLILVPNSLTLVMCDYAHYCAINFTILVEFSLLFGSCIERQEDIPTLGALYQLRVKCRIPEFWAEFIDVFFTSS